jgi:hypothetical protein
MSLHPTQHLSLCEDPIPLSPDLAFYPGSTQETDLQGLVSPSDSSRSFDLSGFALNSQLNHYPNCGCAECPTSDHTLESSPSHAEKQPGDPHIFVFLISFPSVRSNCYFFSSLAYPKTR